MEEATWLEIRRIYEATRDAPTGERRRAIEEAPEATRETLRELLRGRVGSEGADPDAVPGPRDPASGAGPGRREPVPGDLVGPFQLLEVLGRGGMGTVYLAQQWAPLRRRVALKVVRADALSERSRRRFELERGSLARMDHPGIARILEASTTEDGTPWFAMELVDGTPIDEACDSRRLPVRRRVELMVQVAEALQHAHQRGIVHRDLKPSNVLLAEEDGRLRARIIDFGIAKALEDEEQGGPGVTRIGAVIGTPAYMSPEQAAGEPVDLRTDLWSAAMVLHRLLTGRLPYGEEISRESSPVKQLAMMRGVEIDRPSRQVLRIREPDAALEARRTTRRRLSRELRGDLDWIVLRGLARNPEDRFGSAGELAADLRRYLDGRPVLARPDDRLYLLRKFVGRHRRAVAAVALAALGLLGGTVAATWGLLEAREAQRTAAREADRATAVNRFLAEMLEAADPHEGDRDIRVSQVLDAARERLDERFADRPEVRIELLKTIGNTYHHLGRLPDAGDTLREALEAAEVALGAADPRRLEILNLLAEAVASDGDLEEASRLTGLVLAATSPSSPREALEQRLVALNNHGVQLFFLGRGAEGVGPLVESLEGRTALYGPSHPKTLDALGNLAALRGEVDPERAVADLRELAARKAEVFGPEHPSTLASLQSLGLMLRRIDREDEALGVLRDTLEATRRTFGERHQRVGLSAGHLATGLIDLGRFAEALELNRTATEITMSRSEVDGFSVVALGELARNLALVGLTAEALETGRRVLDLVDERLPGRADLRADALADTAVVALEANLPAEAERHFEEERDLRFGLAGDDPAERADVHFFAARDRLRLPGPSEPALADARAAREAFEALGDENGAFEAGLLEAMALARLGRFERALELVVGAVGPDGTPLSDDPLDLRRAAEVLHLAGRDARPALRRAAELLEADPSASLEDRWTVLRDLGAMERRSGDEAAARRLLRSARETCLVARGPESPACPSA